MSTQKQHHNSKSTNDQDFEAYLKAQKHHYEQQDKLLDIAFNKVQNIKSIAIDIGKELDSHKEMLDDMDEEVQKQKQKLKTMNRKLDKLNGESSSTAPTSSSSGVFSFWKWFW
ncbi:hypothetical protein C9374_005074 [Naegleria lovaniensis]|uniref:t-SNARE coiled-coil homology domain-containing protein n=1 Tax=Naegleria lovaniensis TaxID=51637 RepID=A0AA88GNT9_NAELO|nr:uncharacterized protein C9374_005074 [Naegleria lovaniensis]KAG2382494.1 hypothetical protein C9374_005074 [Naegleria lovaniensis]